MQFVKFAIFFADSKSGAQELSNDVSFVIFGHQTWDLEGGPSISWFSSTTAEIGLKVTCAFLLQEKFRNCQRNNLQPILIR